MSKDTPDKTDLSSMSKEELIAYLLKKNESLESQLKQQKEEAQKKEQASVASVSSIVSNLRAELSYKDALLKETLEDQEKLNQEKQQLLDVRIPNLIQLFSTKTAFHYLNFKLHSSI